MSKTQLTFFVHITKVGRMGHCSALIKVRPGYEDIFAGHSRCFRLYFLTTVNPLSPDIKMHILLTVLHTFRVKLKRRVCPYIETSLVITSFILVT